MQKSGRCVVLQLIELIYTQRIERNRIFRFFSILIEHFVVHTQLNHFELNRARTNLGFSLHPFAHLHIETLTVNLLDRIIGSIATGAPIMVAVNR